MKKFVSVLLLSVLCVLIFSSCNEANSDNKEEFLGLDFVKTGEPNMPVYDNLAELEDESAVIVVGTFIGDAKQEEVYTYESYFGKDILSFVVSQNNIEISKVLKGDVKVGDEITITQLYGVVDDRFLTDSKLTPMLQGDTWIFFLSECGSDRAGAFYCTSDNYGRYPLENLSYRKIAFTDNEDLGVYDREDFREDIYNEILEKYDFS